MSCLPLTTVLSTDDWLEKVRLHKDRVLRHTRPARRRKDCGTIHPIEDFLFQYYPFPLSLLENWHPGAGVTLECSDDVTLPEEVAFHSRHYVRKGGMISAEPGSMTEKELGRISWIRDLLVATASRPPFFSCHGLHEWAMVYGGAEIRHEKVAPLRLPQSTVDALVESRPICCSHHDAFRFFAQDAKKFNRLQPSLESRLLHEQPGCVHANMDLYKWCAKTMPWSGSDLLLDCFEVAKELRSLDMRASPYDLAAWGCEPIRIETPEGRRAYEIEQRRLSFLAMQLRSKLIGRIDLTLDLALAGATAVTR
jgi:hypothetical protein